MGYKDYYPNQKRYHRTEADACMTRVAIEDKAERLGLEVEWQVDIDSYGANDDFYGTIEYNPSGTPYIDYIPVLDGRSRWIVKGYTSEYGDEYGYVPNESWSFEDRRKYFHGLGMSKHEAWLQAKESLADEAQSYIGTGVYIVTVRCGDYDDCLGGIYATDEGEALRYFIEDYASELFRYLDEVEQEQNELTFAQVGPTFAYA